MYYFTGYKEPHAILLIFKETQRYKDSISYNELLFVQKRNATQEQWTGRRLGVKGVQTSLGIQAVFNGEAFNDFPIDFSKFSTIIAGELPEISVNEKDPGELSQMVKAYRRKTGMPADYDAEAPKDLNMVNRYDDGRNLDKIMNYLKDNLAKGKYSNTTIINSYINAKDSSERKQIIAGLANEKWNSRLYYSLTQSLREVKTPEEMDLLRKAIEISSIAHTEVMKAIRPEMSEREIEGIHDYVQKKYGAEHWGYPAIVGAGNNGCVLHYEENNKTQIGPRTLLMDVGAEYHGYSADVTRTIPANGKFSTEQKLIYNIVYEAQEAAFKLCKEGSSFSAIETKAREVVANGLVKLGIIKNANENFKYYPHGLSHHIGLDVHDRGSYDKFKKNMVITIEPGIYIPEGSDCDKKWWGIAVRIEDDVLIKENDYELLSIYAPRQAEAVEKMVAEKSGFDNMNLPALKSAKKGF
jgi:Xaa-Pro aminopeptidase